MPSNGPSSVPYVPSQVNTYVGNAERTDHGCIKSEHNTVRIAPPAKVIRLGHRFSNARAGAMTFAPTLIVMEDRITTIPPISTTIVGNFTIRSTGFHRALPYSATVADVTAIPTNENPAMT